MKASVFQRSRISDLGLRVQGMIYRPFGEMNRDPVDLYGKYRNVVYYCPLGLDQLRTREVQAWGLSFGDVGFKSGAGGKQNARHQHK